MTKILDYNGFRVGDVVDLSDEYEKFRLRSTHIYRPVVIIDLFHAGPHKARTRMVEVATLSYNKTPSTDKKRRSLYNVELLDNAKKHTPWPKVLACETCVSRHVRWDLCVLKSDYWDHSPKMCETCGSKVSLNKARAFAKRGYVSVGTPEIKLTTTPVTVPHDAFIRLDKLTTRLGCSPEKYLKAIIDLAWEGVTPPGVVRERVRKIK